MLDYSITLKQFGKMSICTVLTQNGMIILSHEDYWKQSFHKAAAAKNESLL